MKKITDLYEEDNLKLTQSFQEACSDKIFKEYVYNLNIKEEILMKYTSQLQDSLKEFQNCNNCKNLDSCKNDMKGYCNTPINENNIINFSYIACKKLKKQEEDNLYKNNLELFEMPKGIKEASFKNIYKDDKARLPILKFFKDFMNKYDKDDMPRGCYLTGSFGSGKTYLIAALFNEMAKKNIKSVLIYYPDFLVTLKSSFSNNYQEKFNYIKKIPLLLLDDIGAENETNWSRDEVLGPILQYRMDNHLPTFFTSNLTLKELETTLSITSSGVDKVKARRIIERIKQLTDELELISKNRRE